ncbi:hypothetical protein [Clostridium sp. C105KSO13]|uniref:hypothetical protein n=1 Tax=Clostridium sp. C105KSO13 TaxID=1776045 RepID=UPI0007408281|nr:Coenzyme A disulfide reductase [Clostridium sp. C105KSO13]
MEKRSSSHLHATAVGLNKKTLKAAGKQKGQDHESVLINQKSHADYYPEAIPITLKLIFVRDGTIYGAQIFGQDKVNKRIDTIAVTMRVKGTVNDLAELEFAYMPPHSSAKDPVNMLGFVAQNVLLIIPYCSIGVRSYNADRILMQNGPFIIANGAAAMERPVTMFLPSGD